MVLLIDVGSVATKALLLTDENGIWTVGGHVSVKTTEGQPEEDVGVGIAEALKTLQAGVSVDLSDAQVYICNSAGGGLQMVVAGVVRNMTAASARRAALGSGAIVIDVINGGSAVRQPERQLRFSRHRPDIILLAGGTEGGNKNQVIGLAETIAAAGVRSRLSDRLCPVVFAGNSEVRSEVTAFLEGTDVYLSENIRPELESEEPERVNEDIQNIYINSICSNTPGLTDFTEDRGAVVRPCAVGMAKLVDTWARSHDTNALIMDVGGFTTDSYSSIEYVRKAYKRAIGDGTTITTNIGDVRERKVYTAISAASGVAVSAPRLLNRIGTEYLLPLCGQDSVDGLLNACYNRMLRPHDSGNDGYRKPLLQGALRSAFAEHQEVAGKLRGIGIIRNMSEALSRDFYSAGTIAEWANIDHVFLTGGGFIGLEPAEILQAANDALEPQGITTLHADARNRISQLGVWFAEQQETGSELLDGLCRPLATVVAPVKSEGRAPRRLGVLQVTHESGKQEDLMIDRDEIFFRAYEDDPPRRLTVRPHNRVDFGRGFGSPVTRDIPLTAFGLVIDGRRPLKPGYGVKQIQDDYRGLGGELHE